MLSQLRLVFNQATMAPLSISQRLANHFQIWTAGTDKPTLRQTTPVLT